MAFVALPRAEAQSCPCPTQSGTNYRSLGNAGIRANAVTASASLASMTVTFTSALPANVGRGDQLAFTGAPAETLYVSDRISAFQLRLQKPTSNAHTNQTYEIRRAYNTLQSWENDRDGNLVSEDRSEVGVAYADSIPTFTSNLIFDGSTTDATHTMTLTAAEGQRHAGNHFSGVRIDSTGASQDTIDIRDDHVTIEWLVIFNDDTGRNGIRFSSLSGGGNNQVVIRNNVFEDVHASAMAVIDADARADIYNNLVTEGSFGIRLPALNATNSRVRI